MYVSKLYYLYNVYSDLYFVHVSELCGLLLVWEDSDGFTSFFMGEIPNIKFRGKSWNDVNCYYAVLLYEGMLALVYKHKQLSKIIILVEVKICEPSYM